MSKRSAWAEHALRVLREGGYRAGEARRAVVEQVAAQGGCVDAERIDAGLRKRGRRVGTASVYRALGLLSELGLLRRVSLGEGPAIYELVGPGDHHHHHLVCERCGSTTPFEDERLEAAIARLGERLPHSVTSHEVTLHGTCARCERGT